jgi:hypothetical protein
LSPEKIALVFIPYKRQERSFFERGGVTGVDGGRILTRVLHETVSSAKASFIGMVALGMVVLGLVVLGLVQVPLYLS